LQKSALSGRQSMSFGHDRQEDPLTVGGVRVEVVYPGRLAPTVLVPSLNQAFVLGVRRQIRQDKLLLVVK